MARKHRAKSREIVFFIGTTSDFDLMFYPIYELERHFATKKLRICALHKFGVAFLSVLTALSKDLDTLCEFYYFIRILI